MIRFQGTNPYSRGYEDGTSNLAPRSGKISRIHARTGDQVSNNQTLVSFDDEKEGVNDNTKRDTMRSKEELLG